ncbi:hypothetical protein LCGC14_0359070 [marine sediment metagenome]|uniref:Uncharacterized protein n=1 Tax=marine sediment metagenome TaxID=412755 RepID=A0A0F9TRC1_9ZZZZ|nr:hypothetical protein [Candidatus Aminicenantes bacterium]
MSEEHEVRTECDKKFTDLFEWKNCMMPKVAKLPSWYLLIPVFAVIFIAIGYSFIFANNIDDKNVVEHRELATKPELVKLADKVDMIQTAVDRQSVHIESLTKVMEKMDSKLDRALEK